MHVSSTPSQAGGGDSSPGHLIPELMQLEALRIWRICTHQGLCLASVADMYPYLVSLLSPHEQPRTSPHTASPSPHHTSTNDATTTGNTTSSTVTTDVTTAGVQSDFPAPTTGHITHTSHSQSSPVAESVRWSSSCEAYLTLTALVRHAQALEARQEVETNVESEAGKREAVFQMISPGIAAAVAQEDALLWLQPGHLLRVAHVMVALASKSLPVAVEQVEIRWASVLSLSPVTQAQPDCCDSVSHD